MKAVKTEFMKQKKQLLLLCVVFPLLLNGLLYVDLQYRYESYLLKHQSEYGLSCWQLIFKEQTIFYFSELFHAVAAALVYEIFAVDLKSNGWMLVASSKYRNRKVIYGKFMVACIGALIFWVSDYCSLYFVGSSIGVQGGFEAGLFLKSFLIQLSSAIMIIAFFIFLVCVIRRVVYLIAFGVLFLVLNIAVYYGKEIRFLIQYPFSYISHCFRASTKECLLSIGISLVLGGMLFFGAEHMLKRNRDLSL